MANDILIAGDIGGTNARFAAFETSPELRLIQSHWYKSSESNTFDELLDRLSNGELKDSVARAARFVFAVAGPVVEGTTARLPNVTWPVDITAWRKRHGHDRVSLINDFVAQAYATKTSLVKSALLIKAGNPEPDGLVAVVGAGTGLGHCSILIDRTGHLDAAPSEASHQAFAFMDSERDFEAFARKNLGTIYVTPDQIVCGRGLTLLHQFFHNEQLAPPEVAKTLKDDSKVLEWFARFYGRICRHYALAVLPTGGMYITGGVAARNPILVTTPTFTEEFLNAIMHRKVLERIEIRLNAEQESGLWGAARFGIAAVE
jgi:glucokinase